MTRSDAPRPIRRIERAAGVEIDPKAWWARVPAVAAVLEHGLNLPAGVTFLVGENGSGKSTLIEALAGVHGLNAEGGSRGAMHSTRVTESPLASVLQVVRTPGRGGGGHSRVRPLAAHDSRRTPAADRRPGPRPGCHVPGR